MHCPNIECKKYFDEYKCTVRKSKRLGFYIKCPHCGIRLTKLGNNMDGYKKLNNGQIVRKKPKIRMSKKMRLKTRAKFKEELVKKLNEEKKLKGEK